VWTSNPTCSHYLLPPHPIVDSHTMRALHRACLQKKKKYTVPSNTRLLKVLNTWMKLHTHLDLLFKRMNCQLDIYVCCKYETNTLREMTSSSHSLTYGSVTALNSQRQPTCTVSSSSLLTDKTRTLRIKIQNTFITCSAWLYFTAKNNGRGEGEVLLCLNTKATLHE
jgi:hypothetical protein